MLEQTLMTNSDPLVRGGFPESIKWDKSTCAKAVIKKLDPVPQSSCTWMNHRPCFCHKCYILKRVSWKNTIYCNCTVFVTSCSIRDFCKRTIMKWSWASQITGKASCWIWLDKGRMETGEIDPLSRICCNYMQDGELVIILLLKPSSGQKKHSCIICFFNLVHVKWRSC